MIKLCKLNQENVKSKIITNNFDNLTFSNSNLVDDIILDMYNMGLIDCIANGVKDKRADNTIIPFKLIMALAIAAKMKTNTSVSDIPYAITDHRVLANIGYNIIDTNGNLKDGLMRESSLRFLLGKYEANELFKAYNDTLQINIMPKLDIEPNIHILDCTELSVNIKNANYEKSAITTNKYGDADRGYKLATIRGIVNDTGIIEEIKFGAMNTHDLVLSSDMLYTSKVLKENDILIEDRGFLDRETINYLKNIRKVDIYVPLKTNMNAYQVAVSAAQFENNWEPHPNKKRKNQKISLVTNLKAYWESNKSEEDVDFNAAVVWDTTTDNYFVFITTDITKTAKQILMTYELRPEIEEDYRQLKDIWKLEDFKSTKLNMIAFHIITTLFGYLFFQLYTLSPSGEKYAHKSLPIILKNYRSSLAPYLVFYAENEFGILSIYELYVLLPQCTEDAKKRLKDILNKT